MKLRVPYERFGGMNSRNDAEQLDPSRARSARNVAMGRQVMESRRGYLKATKLPVMNRSLELRGLQTGILASRLPANLDGYWNDVVSGNKTKVTLQVRVQGLDLSQVGETDIPYSLDYNGKHERPTESKITVAGGTPPCTAYDYYKRTTTALGYESVDALLWKPPAATNRYDTTGNKKYPWVPGNTAADVSLAAAEKVRPKMACVLGTGPLREFPLWHTNNSQRTWATQVAGGVPDWRNSYRTADVGLPVSAGALRYPAPLATSANVLAGNCDPGDLYIFWVWSPFTQNWHLMALWEYSDPGVSTGSFHAQGMNRMFVFAGWGQEGSNVAAAALDPTQAHTITISLERDFTNGNNSRLEIGVDGASGMYGEVLAVPLPASGDIGGAGNAAPRFGLQELSGIINVAGKRNRNAWRGRTLYLGGLPKATNQRGVYGYGCGHSVNPGGMAGVTCPFPGAYSELRLYAGAFKYMGASDVGSAPDDGVLLAGMSGMAPPNSRTIKRKAGGAAWDHAINPTGVNRYTGAVNIWRLDEEAGDVFDPLYLLAGTTESTGFKTGGLTGHASYVQDFHPFEPVNVGAVLVGGSLGAASGAMRFNGGTPAFSLAAALLRRDRGETSLDANGEPKTTFGLLQPPLEESFLVLYEPVTAPCAEPASPVGSGTGDVAQPDIIKPQQGEVHALLQLVSPNREGRLDSTPSQAFGAATQGFSQGFTEAFDHPDSIWTGSTPDGGTSCGPSQKAPGRRDLEIARLDLVAHRVATAAGTPTEDQIADRFVVRSDWGSGAAFSNYQLDPSSESDKGLSRQQHGNVKFFRRRASKAAAAISSDLPYDEDDDYAFLDADPAAPSTDDAFCYVTLCDAGGTPYTKASQIEGRRFAILFGVQLSQPVNTADTIVGKHTLRVFDITNPASVFECVPSASAASRRSADAGLSWAASTLFGAGKYMLAIGGTIQPQGGEWWMGSSTYPSPIDPDAYPYGCWPLGTNADTRTDPRSVAAGAGMVSHGAKGLVHGVFEFSVNLGVETAEVFLDALLDETEAWRGLVPRAARDVVGDLLRHAWLVDSQGGRIVHDDIGGLSITADESIPLALTTGKTQSALIINNFYGLPTGQVPSHRNVPYTYNGGVNGRMFPDRLRAVKLIDTGRRDSTYGDDDFTTTLLSKISGHPEAANVQPSRETLLAVIGHSGRLGRTDVLVASRCSLLRYDPAGDGTLTRIFSLPQHFTDEAPVSRDNAAGRTVLLNPSGEPVMVNAEGEPVGSEFVERPVYAVPEVWARDMTTDEKNAVTNVNLFPVEFPLAYETQFPRSVAVLGIERIEAHSGMRWTGEMPSIGVGPYGAADMNPGGIGTELVQWAFFLTYWSENRQLESQPGRVFAWSNGAPKRKLYSTSASNEDKYTGEPVAEGLSLIMRGSNPPDFAVAPAKGQPKTYNLRVSNVPLPADSEVSHIRIYRTTVNGSVFFLEQEIPVAAGDAAKGDKLTALLGVKNDIDLTQPHVGGLGSRVPAGARFMATYQGRTYYAGFPWAPHRIYASYQNRPTSVPFFYYIELSGSSSAPVTGLFTDADRLYVFKEDAVYIGIAREWDVLDPSQISRGLPFSFELTQLSAGAVADRAVVSVPEKGIVFAGDSSVYLMAGMQVLRASAPIDGQHEEDLDASKISDATDASRVVYPFALDTSQRERWRAVYYPPLRAVFITGARPLNGEPTFALFTDLLDWAFWTDWTWDDLAVIARYGSEVHELWAVRDSRLWRLDASWADGLDYLPENLDNTSFTSGATNLATGTITAVGTLYATNDDYKLSLLVASLPAAYQALLAGTDERAAGDLLRGVYITVIDPATGLSRFRAPIRYAYNDSVNVRVVIDADALPANPPSVNDQFRLGTIDWHWVSGLTKPADGDALCEAVRLHLQRAPVKATLGGTDFRGSVEVLLDYDVEWPSYALGQLSIPGGTAVRAAAAGFRGRGLGYMLGLVGKGPYAPVALTRGSMEALALGGKGAMGG